MSALVITYLVHTLPLATWSLTNFFVQVPVELEEAAMTDGATRLGALRRVTVRVVVIITIPIALPVIIAQRGIISGFTAGSFR